MKKTWWWYSKTCTKTSRNIRAKAREAQTAQLKATEEAARRKAAEEAQQRMLETNA
ncbi:hypothetical protein ABVN80_03415 [Acinetobacter baumannii]